jgi:ATP-dependent Clp protease ATP-binding subunit ClpC
MFNLYSKRAKRVIFFARREAGARGAEAIELNDLLLALIIEDQDKLPDGRIAGWEHEPFLPSNAATRLLESIRGTLPRSKPVATSVEMPVSSELGETFAAASQLREKLQSKEVTPLYLWAVLCAGANKPWVLQDAQITEEKILEAIREEDRKLGLEQST